MKKTNLWDDSHRRDRIWLIVTPVAIISLFLIGFSVFFFDTDARAVLIAMATALVVLFIVFGLLTQMLMRDQRRAKEDARRLRISEEQYRVALQQSEKNVFRYDIATRTTYRDQETTDNFGQPQTIENVPESMLFLVAEECRDDYVAFFNKIRAGAPTATVVAKLQTESGDWRWYRSDATTIFDSDHRPAQAIISYYDVTELREKEIAYEKWQQELAAMPQDQTALFEWNLTRDVSEGEGGELIGYFKDLPIETFNERTLAYAESKVCPEDRDDYIALLDRALLLQGFMDGINAHEMDYREMQEDGKLRWMHLSVQLVSYPDTDEVKVYIIIRDIDREKRRALEMEFRSQTDALTGVLNRSSFATAMDALIERSPEGVQHAVMMLDIDGFKLVNDTFGHATGDTALVDIANLLRSILRQGDFMGRMGGDEFIICLKDVPYDAVIEKKARQICEMLRKSFSREVHISASVGIAVYPRDGSSFEALYQNMDAALYRVKEIGKDNYAFYRQGMADPAAENPSLDAAAGPPRRRMLIVDDNAMNRELLAEIFKDDFTILQAEDGNAALIAMRRFGAGISIVLLDLVMPMMDGFAVMEKMRQSTEMRSIPVVVVSGADELETSLRAIESGASDFVTKPVDPMLIRLRVHSAISKTENDRLRAQNSYLQLQSEEEARYRTVLESSGTVVVERDWINGAFIYDPSIAEHIAGNFAGRALDEALIADGIADERDVKALRRCARELADDDERVSASRKLMLLTPSGEKHWFRVNMFKRTNESGLINRLILTFNDINEEVLAEQRLQYQAERDILTGLYNRDTFLLKAAELLAAHEPGSHVIVYFDVNRFKAINEMFGYAEGDRFLRYLAERMSADVGNRGLICRLANDHFALCLPYDQAFLRDVLMVKCQQDLVNYNLPFSITASFGVYVVTDPALPVNTMLDCARLAQMSVKGSYRSTAAYYDESMREAELLERELLGEMENALNSGQFEAYYQPQYNHATGALVGAEALVRWNHPTRGMIAPGIFIPIFERNGFVGEIDRFMSNQVCAQLQAWLQAGKPVVPISVNLSRVNLFNKNLTADIQRVFSQYDIPADLFRIEITEGVFVEDQELLTEKIKQLQSLGVLIEMDDFGSGYSSLNVLKNVPVDILKLDMHFLADMDDGGRGGSILTAVIRMAQWLKLPLIAEGVETVAQADYLLSLGCHIVQGYLYARPMPAADFERLLEREAIEPQLQDALR